MPVLVRVYRVFRVERYAVLVVGHAVAVVVVVRVIAHAVAVRIEVFGAVHGELVQHVGHAVGIRIRDQRRIDGTKSRVEAEHATSG